MQGVRAKRTWPALAAVLLLAHACGPVPETQAQMAPVFAEVGRDKIVLQQWDISCGAASLATILTFQHGDPVSEREVVAGLLKHTSAARVMQRLGFSLLDLKRYAEGRGYEAIGYGGLGIQELAALGPAIVPIRADGANHFVVFRGLQDDRVLLADPAIGTRIMPLAEFERVWLDQTAFTVGRRDRRGGVDELAATPADFAAFGGAAAPPPAARDRQTGEALQP